MKSTFQNILNVILQISVRYKKYYRRVSQSMRRYNETSGKSFGKYSENIEHYDRSIGAGYRIEQEERAGDVARDIAGYKKNASKVASPGSNVRLP